MVEQKEGNMKKTAVHVTIDVSEITYKRGCAHHAGIDCQRAIQTGDLDAAEDFLAAYKANCTRAYKAMGAELKKARAAAAAEA